MTETAPVGPERFRLLANYIAGMAIDVAVAPAGQPAHINKDAILVSAGGTVEEQRREVLVQSALLGAGSFDPRLMKGLRARPAIARRYLSLEGRRVLAELAERMPIASAALPVDGTRRTASSDESLEIAKGDAEVADPPAWFGVLKPAQLVTVSGPGTKATDKDLRLEFDLADIPETEDEDEEDTAKSGESKILKLFDNPLFSNKTMSDFLRKLMGNSRSPGEEAAGGELQIRSIRRSSKAGPDARPLATPIHFTDDGKPAAALGVRGVLHPEWDTFNNCYKEDWCRVLDFPLAVPADVADAAVVHDEVLRRRLSRVGLGPKLLRSRADGDDLDIEALIDLFVDLRSGYSPPEHIYTERRKLARNLGVLILLDSSGSVTESDSDGLAVHEHQRRAAATIAATLEELGDRVAVYGFRSEGRRAVHLPAIKTFGQRFGALSRARLNQLQPTGYTRLGAAIRGAAKILETEAGTPNRLLLVLSDGYPYDQDYEGRYAEADTHKAFEEVRADGIACLCLSIGATADSDALARVFGSASHASAEKLSELSPRMDELFLSSLKELSVSRSRG
ncbi:VWA domain-containing protein [Aldersonia sp. NBC_00410]|uniref:nitric oxide reductase activation protein NorD n=1 Tax=Aldersonia sp. NBC_00410 TaxID=2975954 RepID=UPI00225AE020|nr:VWA domain-containing protein [Aldersonia sp. NBC_00410]MCX5044723.1 VWA domain-containing protein [Aldersonia sp. NBC_00410]